MVDHERRGRPVAAIALSLASGLGGWLLAGSARDLLEAGVRSPDAAVAVGVHGIGLLLLAWYLGTALVATACALARLSGRMWGVGERAVGAHGAPLARRLLVVGAGAAVAAATVVAPATGAPVPPEPSATAVTDDLGWGADAEPVDEPSSSEESAPTSATATTPESGAADAESTVDSTPVEPADDLTTAPSVDATEVATQSAPDEDPPSSGDLDDADDPSPPDAPEGENDVYVVLAGDSLWSIAAAHLSGDATEADIAASWPHWYRTNLAAIGADADLIHPGLVLQAPSPLPQEES